MKRVLVADDEPAFAEFVCDVLLDSGYVVSCASSGSEALKQFRTSPTDVVILDLFMPDGGGLETLLEFRREFPTPKLLVVTGKQYLLSGNSLGLAETLGADRTLLKPFTPKELLQAVAALEAA
jgi:DNA-binding response OmpR family regulator